jgi:hypothetical protein
VNFAENVASPSITTEQAASSPSYGLGPQGSHNTCLRYYRLITYDERLPTLETPTFYIRTPLSTERSRANFYEKALFVKGDLATDRSVANATALPFALCFYPHFRGAHASVARCIMGSVFSG